MEIHPPVSTIKRISVLHEILTWSLTQPNWQRDALRRIVEKGSLDDMDFSELKCVALSKLQIDTIKPSTIESIPLGEKHLPPTPGNEESVSIVSISNIQNVNRLPQNASISFGETSGLTIIYGGNAAGKSSYARIIKKACRARGELPEITSNVYEQSTTLKPASATISIHIGSKKERSLSWTAGLTADPLLSNIFVFDSFSAEHYISIDSAAAFTPHGLDILPKLSLACDELMKQLRIITNQHQDTIDAIKKNWKYDSTTKVGKLLANLSATTRKEDVDILAEITAEDKTRQLNLRELLKTDPLQKAKETKAMIARLESFSRSITVAVSNLSDEECGTAQKQIEQVIDARNAVLAFAKGQFDTSFLAGTGSNLWRTLWEAAREYSNKEAYQNQIFPVISDGAKCVLCQQNVDNDIALKNLSRFDTFCLNKSQEVLKNIANAISKKLASLNPMLFLCTELEKITVDLSSLTEPQLILISNFVASADKKLKELKNSLSESSWHVSIESLNSPELIINNLIVALRNRAIVEESAHEPITRAKLAEELKELDAREWLSANKTDVLAQINRLETISQLKACEKDLKTDSITRQSTILTKSFVTDKFKDRFKRELKKLELKTLDVELESIQGKKGETKFGLRLTRAPNAKIAKIASKGEQQCIALAAFLAELSQASHNSALVFDDPVSSLDHSYREKIAHRLIEESKVRQVIIFTHDIVFLSNLETFSEDVITPNIFTLEWYSNAPGNCISGLPWDIKKPKNCLTDIEKEQKIIASQWNPHPNEGNIKAIRHQYSLLRATLEKIVETDLLSGVVKRFDRQILTREIHNIIGITVAECDEVKRLIDKCHKITDAHAAGINDIPTPEDLLKDIQDTRALIEVIINRKKQS